MSLTELIEPHGNQLINLFSSCSTIEQLRQESMELLVWNLTDTQLCDLEMLMNGSFSPLKGFMTETQYNSVCSSMRLPDGALWSIPITLDISRDFSEKLSLGHRLTLLHPEGMPLAILDVKDIWEPDPKIEAVSVFGTDNQEHPAVFRLFNKTNPIRIGGTVQGIEPPPNYSFTELRHTPKELRELFKENGFSRVVAFQTRNPMHRAHVELTKRAMRQTGAHLLINPVVGVTKPGDIDAFVRVRCYKSILKYYERSAVSLSLLPLAMRMAGPREALWHAIIRKNFGCSHFIVGRDHAGPGKDSTGKPYYGPYEAQNLLAKYAGELGISTVLFEEMVYLEDKKLYVERSEAPKGAQLASLSGTELRRRIAEEIEIPEWFSYPEVIAELRKSRTPRSRQGFVVFFTGLPSSGKSTIARAFVEKLLETTERAATVLDGDLVRKNLSSELTFSKEHRDLNILRIGFVASEITRHGGVAVCAPIAPYAAIRRKVREMVGAHGGFIEIHVDTPLEECERRDRKGLYAKARSGLLKDFTGVDDPYENPEKPELRIQTMNTNPSEAALIILEYLKSAGYISLNEL